MSAAGQSTPASRLPRRTPSIVRLSPQLVNTVCTLNHSHTTREPASVGLLFGTVLEHLVTVQAVRPLSDDECGRIYSSDYNRAGPIFENLLEASKAADPELLTLNLVGWLSTRPDTGLIERDIEFHKRYFRRASDIAVLVRPARSSDYIAKLYARSLPARFSTDDYRSASFRLWDTNGTSAPVEVAIPGPIERDVPRLDQPAADSSAPTIEAAIENAKRNLRWFRLAVIGAVVMLALLSVWQLKSGKGTVESPRAIPTDTGFDLRAMRRGDGLLVTWDRRNPAVQSATQAVLRINDGSEQHTLHLDRAQIATGTVFYNPTSGDITFRLEIKGKRGTNAESTRVLDGRKLEAGNASPPKNARLAIQQPTPASVVSPRDVASETRSKTRVTAERAGITSLISPPPAASLSFTVNAPPFAPLLGSSSKAPTTEQASSAEARGPAVSSKQPATRAEANPSQLPQTRSSPPSDRPRLPAPSVSPSPASRQPKSNQVAGLNTAPASRPAPAGPRTPDANVAAAYVAARPLREVMPETQTLRVFVYKVVEIPVEVTIDENGHVTAARMAKSDPDVNLALSGAAINAAKQWRYEPATLHGQHIPSRQTIVFQFQPRE